MVRVNIQVQSINAFEMCFFLLLPHHLPLLCEVDVSYMSRLHFAWSCASSPDNSLSDKSFLMLSSHLRFGLPLLLLPGTSVTITILPTYSSPFFNTCPYHFYQRSCTFLDISTTFAVPLILSFLILSSLGTPLIHLNILIFTLMMDVWIHQTGHSISDAYFIFLKLT